MSVGWGQDCGENMYEDDCGLPLFCNPTCLNPEPSPDCPPAYCGCCCFCNEGYIFSDGSYNECILIEDCPIIECDEDYIGYQDTSECEYYAEGTIGGSAWLAEEWCDYEYTFSPNEEYIELFPIFNYDTFYLPTTSIHSIDYSEVNQIVITFGITESQCYFLGAPTYMVPTINIIEYEFGWNQVLGDVNGDGILNVLDVVLLVNIIIDDGEYIEDGDVNEDGVLNVLDVVILVNLILDGEPSICDGLTEVELWGQYYDIGTTAVIDLINQGLTGLIQPEIGCLTNLTYLSLGWNQLTGDIPQEVCDLIENNNLLMSNILTGNNLINTCD